MAAPDLDHFRGASTGGRIRFALRGSESYANHLDIKDKILVELGAPRFVKGTSAVLRSAPEGSIGLLEIDSTGGPEPRQWPIPYTAGMLIGSPPQPSPDARAPARPAPFGMAFRRRFDASG